MAEEYIDLCKLKASEVVETCGRKPPEEEVRSYQQQILHQAKSLGQLRRHYVARKCYEEHIDEKKALADICRYKRCYPHCSELQLLQILLQTKACPDTIIYQTYVVEAEKGKCCGAEETFRKLKQGTPASKPKRLLRPCCDEEHPLGSVPKHYDRTPHPGTPIPQQRPTPDPRRQAVKSRPKISISRPQSKYQDSPCPVGPPARPPCAPQAPCSPCATPLPCPGPRPPTPLPKLNLTPCGQTPSPCPTSQWGQPQASTPMEEGAAAYFGSPGQSLAFLRPPGETPETKRKTRIPVAIRQDLTKSQKRQARDTTGSRIPCPISTQVPRSTRFSRVQISFGGTQVSYFEDTMPSLVGPSQLEESQFLAVPLSPAMLPQQPKQFKEYKSMIDQEKKEIREMHNVVTQLMDRPEKVEFRDMYSLVPQISYIDDTLVDPAPEVAAAMLHSDELGLNMKSPPAEVYNTLFKGGDMDKTLIKVTPEENAQSVVPLSSEGFEAALLGYEQQGLFENVDPEMEYDLPEMPKGQEDKEDDEGDEYDETLKEDDQPAEDADEQPGEEEAEQPPGEEDSQEQLPPPRLSRMHSGGSAESDEATFDVQLQLDLCSCDFLQIRGSQPPTWFPGYFVAMGDSTKINVVRKPWDILEKVWRKFEPSTMKPDNGTYVLGI